MDNKQVKTAHYRLSIALYLICLVLPAYYATEIRTPEYSLELLAFGWLALNNGIISWLANPIYIIALVTLKRPLISAPLAIIALVCALSTLSYSESVLLADGVMYKAPMSFGWGYFLWVLSIGVYAFGQTVNIFSFNKQYSLVITNALFIVVSTSIFLHHYYFSANSVYKLHKERKQTFDDLCSKTESVVLATVNDADSLYFNYYTLAGYSKIYNGIYHSSRFGLVPPVIYDYGIQSIERNTQSYENISTPYARQLVHSKDWKPASKLEASYLIKKSLLTESLNPALGLHGFEIRITSSKTGDDIARTSYITSKVEKWFCGESISGIYSEFEFITKALNLSYNKSLK